uniref:Uncharacterized protein n=1 Tax=Tanacetum cinerariifolium TaxID=118510 RepID=A0A6L2K1T7_TANCI|nr:hypothetical protein [Tanacetum cinerariifolium]
MYKPRYRTSQIGETDLDREANFSEFTQTNQFARAVSSIPEIVHRYIDQQMNEAVKIIKDRVKEQVKVQVSKILPKIEQTVNEQLEDEFLTRLSNSSKTSYAVAADLSETELKKILIEKIEWNKSIHRYNGQRNLYKALIEAYESDKIILDTYEDTVTLKRRRDDDADKDEEPSAGSDRGSKRRREGKELESTSAPREKATRMELELFLEEVYKVTTDQLDWVNPEGQQYPYNLLKPLPLIPNSRGCRVIPFDHFMNNDLEYLCGVSYDKHALWGISHWGRKRQQFYGFAVNRKSARDVYSKCRILAVTELKIVEKADKSDSRRTLCFKRLSSNVYKKHRNPKAYGRPSTRCRSYQKKLNLTKSDTYRSDLKRKEAYISYSNPRGFIYQNKDKQNGLMQIDELHKFSDGTLTDVRTALDDILKGFR